MRLIDSDALVSSLQETLEELETLQCSESRLMERAKRLARGVPRGIRLAIKQIAEQPTINPKRLPVEWIPADKPPKGWTIVLLSFENLSAPSIGWYAEDENGGAYYCGDVDVPCCVNGRFVNAWMPLPAPYHASAQNGNGEHEIEIQQPNRWLETV